MLASCLAVAVVHGLVGIAVRLGLGCVANVDEPGGVAHQVHVPGVAARPFAFAVFVVEGRLTWAGSVIFFVLVFIVILPFGRCFARANGTPRQGSQLRAVPRDRKRVLSGSLPCTWRNRSRGPVIRPFRGGVKPTRQAR